MTEIIKPVKTREKCYGEARRALEMTDGYQSRAQAVLIPKEGQKLFCPCGYELVKEDEKSFKCTGGNHRYYFRDGTVVFDKFGNACLAGYPMPSTAKKKEVKP